MRVLGYVRAMIDLFLPRTCVVCGRRLNVHEKHLCLYCLSDLPFTRFWTMKHNPMADRFNSVIQNGLDDASSDDQHEKYAYASALLFYDEESNYRHIPHQIKYQGNISAGRYFGRMFGQELRSSEWAADIDMVIPVPLHWIRRWNRGYNQAEIIASEVASELSAPIRTDILKRVRRTRTQTKLDVSAKSANVAGAFAASIPQASLASEGNPRHILLVDDVFTSGATLHSCFVALRTIFPSSVRISVATLAFVGEV